MIDLTTTYDAPMTRAEDINAIGQIVGGSVLLEPDGTVIELGSLGGGGTSALAVNDHGQVVGHSRRRGDGPYQGFVWTDGVMTNVSSLGGYEGGSAYGLNNLGQIIGAGSGPRPWCGSSFLYDPAIGVRRLRDLIPVDSGWASLGPYDINNEGQIAGTGDLNGATRAFLMSPVRPEEVPIPAVSQWGAVVLALLIPCAACLVLRNPVAQASRSP
jgi:probable HAF family extracellular repeat protein